MFRFSSHSYDGSSVDGIFFYRNQSFVDLVEWECGYLRSQINLARDLEEISSVSTSHVRDTPKLALAPEQAIIVKLGDSVQVNCVDGNRSSLPQAGQGCYYDVATRSESDRAVELLGRPVSLTPHPSGPKRSRQLAMTRSSGGDIHLAIPGAQNRYCQMGRSAEPEQPDTIAALDTGDTKAAKANDACAQERGSV